MEIMKQTRFLALGLAMALGAMGGCSGVSVDPLDASSTDSSDDYWTMMIRETT
jgi:hypothetical protein